MRISGWFGRACASDDWQTLVCPVLVGRAGVVTVELRGIEARFSPQRNARCLIGIEGADFARILQMETSHHLLRVQSATNGGRMWCEGCKATLAHDNGLQAANFTVSPTVSADYEVSVTMPGVLCTACGCANFASHLLRPGDAGDLLGRELLDALGDACRQIEF